VKYLMRPDELVPAVRTALDSPMLMIQRPDLREKALEAVAALVAERDRYKNALGSSLLNPTQARRLAVALLEAAAYIEAPGEARRREQELRADLTQARSALQQIRDYVLLEYQEGDKPFQLAILAVTALDETQDPWQGVYPGMCVDPEICRGYGHCPRPYSCSE
jgi:hypothetical protein